MREFKTSIKKEESYVEKIREPNPVDIKLVEYWIELKSIKQKNYEKFNNKPII